MYQDFYLRFADEDEANAVLFDMQHDGEGYNKVPKYAAVDVIGTIYKPTGKVLPAEDGSGDAVDEMAPIPGFHANVRHMGEAAELVAYVVTPQNPVRGWA